MLKSSQLLRLGALPLSVFTIGFVSLVLGAVMPVVSAAGGQPEQIGSISTNADVTARWPSVTRSGIELTSRPVFHQSRVLYSNSAPAVIEPPPPKPIRKLAVSGIFSSGQSGYMAALVDESSNEQIVVREGDEIDGFDVKRIDRESVTFTRGDEQRILRLHPDQP